jgi:hypothetical protein
MVWDSDWAVGSDWWCVMEDERDEAIRELANIASNLLKHAAEIGMPGIIRVALENKINYYAMKAGA